MTMTLPAPVPAAVRPTQPSSAGRNRSLWPWWIAAALIPMMFASEFKLRTRSDTATISGKPDIFIYVEIIVYILVAVFLSREMPWRLKARRFTAVRFAGWAFAVYYALTAVYSPYKQLAFVRAAQMILIAAIANAIANRATREHVNRFAHGFILLVSAGVFIGLVHPTSHLIRGEARFTWLAIYPTVSGAYAGLATVVAVAYLAVPRLRDKAPKWPMAVRIITAGLCLFGVAATRTRGAIAGALIGIVVLMLVAAGRRHRATLSLIGFIFVGVLALGAGAAVVTYLERGETAAQLSTLNYRTHLWSDALAAWQQRPLFGYGLGATRGLFLQETGLGGGHNAFINVIVDSGIVGILLWLGLIALVIREVWRCGRLHVGGQEPALLAAVIAFLVTNALTIESLGASATGAMMWLYALVGWTAVLMRERPPGSVAGTTAPSGRVDGAVGQQSLPRSAYGVPLLGQIPAGQAMPNLFIIGAPKSGTTSLHAALSQHPDIGMSEIKEPKYYLSPGRPAAWDGPGDRICAPVVWRREQYLGQFRRYADLPVRGEATPFYLSDPEALRRIRADVPDAKLVVLLRQPVDRAYSNWADLWSQGRETSDTVAKAIELEAERTAAGWEPFWRYRSLGCYGTQLQQLLEIFPAEQVLVLLHDDYVAQPETVLRTVCSFAGVDPYRLPPAASEFHENATGYLDPQGPATKWQRLLRDHPAKRWLPSGLRHFGGILLRRRLENMSGPRPEMTSEERRVLLDYYRDEIALTEALTGLDLHRWTEQWSLSA